MSYHGAESPLNTRAHECGPSTASGVSLQDHADVLRDAHQTSNGHGPLSPSKARGRPSLAFAPIYHDNFSGDASTKKRSKVFALMSAGLPMVAGALIAVCAFLACKITEELGKFRVELAQSRIREGNWFLAWIEHTAVMLVFTMLGACPVIFHEKTAGSSGIPALIALLNGCDLKSEFSALAVLCKLWGVIMAVSAGLAVGPEGPMIFIGAGIGAILSRLPSWPYLWKLFKRPRSGLKKDVYLRDYIAAGAACGIAAAFKAPLAGTMFVIEETASRLETKKLFKVLMASLVALCVTVYIGNGASLLEYEVTTGPQCQRWPSHMSYAVLWFLSIGIVCGCAGALFNFLVSQVAEIRAQHASAQKPGARIADLVIICILTSSAWIILPALSGERESSTSRIFACSNGCLHSSLMSQVINRIDVIPATGTTKDAKDYGNANLKQKLVPRSCLYGVQHKIPECHTAFQLVKDYPHDYPSAHMCTHGLQNNTALNRTARFDDYCCAFDNIEALKAGNFSMPWNTSCNLQFSQLYYPSFENSTHINTMAALSLVPFAHTATNLFIKGAPFIIPFEILLLFLVVFFLIAVVTAGSAIPAGLLLPQIIIGALIGRLVTLVYVFLMWKWQWVSPASRKNSIWSPEYAPFFSYADGPLKADVVLAQTGFPDAGLGAIAGAGAFLGGSGRIALFGVVMLVEVTGDPLTIMPVGIATIVAVIIANMFNRHGLYHILIDMQSFPFLPDHWPEHMPQHMRIREMLQKFETEEERKDSIVKLYENDSLPDVQEKLRKYPYEAFPVIGVADQGMIGIAERRFLKDLGPEDTVRSVTDTYPGCVVRADLLISVAYELFNRMEVKRLIVVDEEDAKIPVAVLTRNSLLPWVVDRQRPQSRASDVVEPSWY